MTVDEMLAVAADLKQEAGVREHKVRKSLTGLAYTGVGPSRGNIIAPEGRTRCQLFILAHECGHIAMHMRGPSGRRLKPRYIIEYEAELYAHDALRIRGIQVPKQMTERAKSYVRRLILYAYKRGSKIRPDIARWAGWTPPPSTKRAG